MEKRKENLSLKNGHFLTIHRYFSQNRDSDNQFAGNKGRNENDFGTFYKTKELNQFCLLYNLTGSKLLLVVSLNGQHDRNFE